MWKLSGRRSISNIWRLRRWKDIFSGLQLTSPPKKRYLERLEKDLETTELVSIRLQILVTSLQLCFETVEALAVG